MDDYFARYDRDMREMLREEADQFRAFLEWKRWKPYTPKPRTIDPDYLDTLEFQLIKHAR